MREGQSDRKGVGRSRGQGETVNHRPESRTSSRTRYTLSLWLSCRMHLRATAETGCKRETEGDGKATFTAGAQPVTASVPHGTAPAMDAESPAVAVRCTGTAPMHAIGTGCPINGGREFCLKSKIRYARTNCVLSVGTAEFWMSTMCIVALNY